jgi:hypothetical protein
MTSKISLQLNESNQLKFKINVQGTTTEGHATKPVIRLVLSPKDDLTGMSLVFPVLTTEKDVVVFSVPVLDHIINPKVEYTAKVEVIIGTRIFVPVTFDVTFENPLKVEALIFKEETSPTVNVEQNVDVFEALTEKPAPKQQVSMTRSELFALITKKRQAAPVVLKEEKKSEDPLKSSLKSLMKSALSEED